MNNSLTVVYTESLRVETDNMIG